MGIGVIGDSDKGVAGFDWIADALVKLKTHPVIHVLFLFLPPAAKHSQRDPKIQAIDVGNEAGRSGFYFGMSAGGSQERSVVDYAGFAALQDTGAGRPRRVLGIDASATLDTTRAQVERIARHTAALIEVGRDLRPEEITVLEGWAGDYYGIPVDSTVEAIRLSGRLEGMIIDPVYEGKSMAGLIDLVTSGEIGADSTVLYAHLGGQPALNAYSGIFD